MLTDLKPEGFMVASRQEQLDWAHCELILQQTGRLHATSMILAQRVSILKSRKLKKKIVYLTRLHTLHKLRLYFLDN